LCAWCLLGDAKWRPAESPEEEAAEEELHGEFVRVLAVSMVFRCTRPTGSGGGGATRPTVRLQTLAAECAFIREDILAFGELA